MRTWFPWVMYVINGILVPYAMVTLSVILDSEKTASNISICVIALCLQNVFFFKTVSLKDGAIQKRSLITTAIMFCVYIILFFGIQDPNPPEALVLVKLDTNNCQRPDYPLNYTGYIPGGFGRGTCAVNFWYKNFFDSSLEESLNTSAGSVLSLSPNIQRIMSRSKTAYDIFKYESTEFVISSTVSSNVDTWSPNSKADAKKECRNSITEFFCSLTFRPCTADCSRELKACRSTCMKVLDTCSHASFAYASQGPGSFEREGKTIVGAGITEGLGKFRDISFKALADLCRNDTLFTDETPCGTQSFIANDTLDGACNLRHRSMINSANAAKKSNYAKKMQDYDAEKDRINQARFSLHFVLLFCNILGLWLVRAITGESTPDADSEYRIVLWSAWWENVPSLTPFAVFVQVTSLVILQISARRAEGRGVYYVTILEILTSLFILYVIEKTMFCYTSLVDEEVDIDNHDKLLASSSLKEKLQGVRQTIGLFGKYYQYPLVLSEIVEIIIQLFYFFQEVKRTDSFIMLVSCIVLSLNIAISPFLIFKDRYYSTLFDCVIEVFYFLFNFALSSATEVDNDVQLIQMLSLIFSAMGSASTLASLAKYIYFRNKHLISDAVGDAQDYSITVKSIKAKGEEAANAEPQEPGSPRRTVFNVTAVKSSKAQGEEATKVEPQPQKYMTSASVLGRFIITSFCCVMGLTFLLTTVIRIGIQNDFCREESGMLWNHVPTKLFFSDGYFAPTRCDFSVVTRVDLSGRGLTDLPPSLALMTKLTFLNVSNNKIRVLGPEIIPRLPLRTLDISDNIIHYIHPKVLYSDHRDFQYDEVEEAVVALLDIIIGNNPVEERIDWSFHNLTQIPPNLKVFLASTRKARNTRGRPLKYLNLSHNSIDFQKGQHTIITFNTCYGTKCSQDDLLADLDLSHNNITRLNPTWVNVMKQIQRVNLSFNFIGKDTLFETLPLSSLFETISSGKETNDRRRFVDFTNNKLPSAPLLLIFPIQEKDIILDGNNITVLKPMDLLVELSDMKDLDWPMLHGLRSTLQVLDINRLVYSPTCPLGLWGSTSLRIANFSHVRWGSGEPLQRSSEYTTWWDLLMSFPNLHTVDISNRIVQCLIPPKGKRFAFPNLKRLFVRYAGDVSVLHGDFTGLPNLRELDMTLYKGALFPTPVLSLSLLEELHADWSSIGSTTLNLTQMVSLRALSLTGMGLNEVMLPSGIQTLFLGYNKLRISLGSLLSSLTQLTLLDYEGSLTDENSAILTEPLISSTLQCLLLGPGYDGEKQTTYGRRRPWVGGGSFPSLKVADLRGLSVTATTGLISAPSLRLVCVHEADISECTKRFPDATCTTRSQCRMTPPCSPPRFPIFVGFPLTLRDTMLSTGGIDLPCASCDSKCYKRSVLGSEPYPLVPSDSSLPIPTTSSSGGIPSAAECEGERATQGIAGDCLASIGTNLLMKPTGTKDQTATNANLASLKQYASVLGAACSSSLNRLLCSVPFPRCIQGRISKVCSAVCTEANVNCEAILPLLPKAFKKYQNCTNTTFYGNVSCFD